MRKLVRGPAILVFQPRGISNLFLIQKFVVDFLVYFLCPDDYLIVSLMIYVCFEWNECYVSFRFL